MKKICKLLTILSAAITMFASFATAQTAPVKYVFLMIGDGMGPNQREIAEKYSLSEYGRKLPMNHLEYSSRTTTHSANKPVTDSSASGTAIACGEKIDNGVVGITPDGRRLVSIARSAKANGKKVGIISSVTLNHATPASFYAHQKSRSSMYDIALEMLDTDFDFFGGGGIMLFDDKKSKNYKGNIYELLKSKGYKVCIEDAETFKNLKSSDGKIVAVGKLDKALAPAIEHFNKKSQEPTLADYVKKAIEVLDNDRGFFIMCEGGAIDWFCHGNDAAGAIFETVDFSNAVDAALEFAKKHPNETLVVVTADHETGGLQMLENGNIKAANYQKESAQKFAEQMKGLAKRRGTEFKFEDTLPFIESNFAMKADGGKSDAMSLSGEEMRNLKILFDMQFHSKKKDASNMSAKEKLDNKYESYKTGKNPFNKAVLHCFSKRIGCAWTTGNHTATDIITTAQGVNAEKFGGKTDNTDMAKIIRETLK